MKICSNDSCFIGNKRPVRRAGNLRGLQELNLSESTREYLEKTFLSIDGVIKLGRERAFESEVKPTKRAIPKWQTELIAALREAGFIRPANDFIYSFNLGKLYADIFPNDDCFMYPSCISRLTNEQYEDFRYPTDMEVQTVKSALKKHLTEREFKTIYYHYGLVDGRRWPFKEIGKMFGVGSGAINMDFTVALLKLQNQMSALALSS